MASRKNLVNVIVLGGAFLTGFLAMTVAGRGWWGASSGGADPTLVAAAGDRDWRTGTRGYVVLTAAMAAHPAWAELTALTAEVEREQQSLAAERSGEAAIAREAGADLGTSVRQVVAAIEEAQGGGREKTRAALQTAYRRQWEAEQTRLLGEAERKVAERRAVLAAQVDERVGVKRGQLKAALEQRVEQIRRQREARLLSLQLQLGLKGKDPAAAARADSLQRELSQLQASIQQEIEAAQKSMERELAAFARETEEQAKSDLQAYSAKQAEDAAQKAEAVRQRLEAELERRLQEVGGGGPAAVLPGSGEGAGRRSSAGSAAADSPTPLQLRRNALQAKIMADVRRVAALVAREHGLGVPRLVATAAERPAGEVDLTGAVTRALMR